MSSSVTIDAKAFSNTGAPEELRYDGTNHQDSINFGHGVILHIGQMDLNGPVEGDHNERSVVVNYPKAYSYKPRLVISVRTKNSDVDVSGVYWVHREDKNGFTVTVCTTKNSSYGDKEAKAQTISWIAIGRAD